MTNIINLKNLPSQVVQTQRVIEELFQNQLIGIYLYGSAIHGGLNINSDLDILVISCQCLSSAQRKELTKQLMSISGKIECQNKRPLEVTIFNQSDISPWQFPPKYEYMYGEWLRKEMEAGSVPQACYDPDAAILLWQARNYSLTLKGLDASKVIEPIQMKYVHKAIENSLSVMIEGTKGDERNTLLTLARMWFTLSTDEICPKDKAAEWALPRIPQNLRFLLEMAQKAYLGKCKDSWSCLDAEIALLVTFMSKSIEDLLINKNTEKF